MIFLTIASLSNENADVPDVMNENGKLDISLDGSLLFHTMNLNTIVLGPPVRNLSSQSTEKEKISKYQLPVSIFDVRDVNVLVS